jgi:hypothetical protein
VLKDRHDRPGAGTAGHGIKRICQHGANTDRLLPY